VETSSSPGAAPSSASIQAPAQTDERRRLSGEPDVVFEVQVRTGGNVSSPYCARTTTDGTEISASNIARAGVDRSFLYRHRDLLDQIHGLEATPPAAGATPGPTVTRASLQADLLAAGERAQLLHGRARQLE
jgi:hypothetical protein